MKINKIFKIAFSVSILICANTVSAQYICVLKKAPVKKGAIDFSGAFKVQASKCTGKYAEVSQAMPQLVGFANIGSNGVLLSEGGSDITSVVVTPYGEDSYAVTFNGTFPGLTSESTDANESAVQILGTAKTASFPSLNAYVDGASSSQIVVVYYLWQSNNDVSEPLNGVTLSVFLGSLPPG